MVLQKERGAFGKLWLRALLCCTRRMAFFVLYFSGICVKIENDRLVGTGSDVESDFGNGSE